ncbi:hypothetical protein [Streptomyces sp. NBC_01615]|uniref:hypothetical protein n=1 Tax=Streptomyces sp. NBC_01615 TaxID=2975898 RepID=UPI00386F7637
MLAAATADGPYGLPAFGPAPAASAASSASAPRAIHVTPAVDTGDDGAAKALSF